MKIRTVILFLISLINVFGSDEETNKGKNKQGIHIFRDQNIYNDPQKVQDFLNFKKLFNGNEIVDKDAKKPKLDMKHNMSGNKQEAVAEEKFAEILAAENSQNGTADTGEKKVDENIGEGKTTFSEIINEGQFAMNCKSWGIESYKTPQRLFTAKSDELDTQMKIPRAKHKLVNEKNIFTKTFDIPSNHFPPKQQTFKEQIKGKNETILFDNSLNVVENRAKTPFINRYTCKLCDGDICLAQPFIECTNGRRGHAICLAGYGGERCEFYPRQKAESLWKPNRFGNCLLEIFEKYHWLNTYYHMEFIWKELEKRIGNSQNRNEYFFVRQMRLLNFKIAYWHEEFEGKTVHWYIHRKNWQQPENVNWQRYITQILKAKHTIPVVDFSYNSNGVKPIIPHKLLDFIKQYTRFASFEEAVREHMLNVEIFHKYSDMDSMLVKLMRLKNEPEFVERPLRYETAGLFKKIGRENIETVDCNPEFDEKRKNGNFNYTDDILFEFNVFQDSKQSSPIKNPSKM